MQRREFISGLGAAFGWFIGSDLTWAAENGDLETPSPRSLKIAMSDGASIAVEVSGIGPSLLLVHGTAATRRSWARVTPLLQSRYQTLSMNRRGRDDSSDGSTFSLAREAEDIARVADQIPGPVFVFGHSYGAIAVLEALRLTGKIERAVLYEPPLPVAGGIGAGISPDAVCSAVAAGDNERAMLTFFKDYARLPAQQIDAFRSDPAWPARIRLAPSVCREVQSVSTYTFDPSRFSRISKPTLFLLGSESPPAMAISVRSGAAALPNSQLHLLPGQQHDAMYTAPEMLAHEISGFLLT